MKVGREAGREGRKVGRLGKARESRLEYNEDSKKLSHELKFYYSIRLS